MSDDKADRIRAKISASQARSRGSGAPRKDKPAAPPRRGAADDSDRRSVLDRALDDHPLALLAGSMVLGAVAATLIPASVGRKLGSRALGLVTVAGELGALYGAKAWDTAAQGARSGQDKLEDIGDALAEQGGEARRRAVELGTLAARRALDLAEAAARNARDASGHALKAIGELSERARS